VAPLASLGLAAADVGPRVRGRSAPGRGRSGGRWITEDPQRPSASAQGRQENAFQSASCYAPYQQEAKKTAQENVSAVGQRVNVSFLQRTLMEPTGRTVEGLGALLHQEFENPRFKEWLVSAPGRLDGLRLKALGQTTGMAPFVVSDTRGRDGGLEHTVKWTDRRERPQSSFINLRDKDWHFNHLRLDPVQEMHQNQALLRLWGEWKHDTEGADRDDAMARKLAEATAEALVKRHESLYGGELQGVSGHRPDYTSPGPTTVTFGGARSRKRRRGRGRSRRQRLRSRRRRHRRVRSRRRGGRKAK